MFLSSLPSHDDIRRRRLLQRVSIAQFQAAANPNSCVLGGNIAQSADMEYGIATLCNLRDITKKESIIQGLFRRHSAQTAITHHLISTGSLYVTDENGDSIKINTNGTFPTANEPCIATDPDTLRVFAVGGYDENGDAVDTIEVYQFDDDNLASGEVIASWIYKDEFGDDYFADWTELKLDTPRYGAVCVYWKRADNEEYIIVINGMKKTSDITPRNSWHKDVKLIDLSTLEYYPTGTNTLSLSANIMDSRPLIDNTNDVLYLFGGRTHIENKGIVQRVDLGDALRDEITKSTLFEMTEKRVLPLVEW